MNFAPKIITSKICSKNDKPLILNRLAFHTKIAQVSKSDDCSSFVLLSPQLIIRLGKKRRYSQSIMRDECSLPLWAR